MSSSYSAEPGGFDSGFLAPGGFFAFAPAFEPFLPFFSSALAAAPSAAAAGFGAAMPGGATERMSLPTALKSSSSVRKPMKKYATA